MSTLTLELSDEQLRILERLAQRRGTSIDTLIMTLIEDLAARSEPHDAYDVTQDPLYNITPHDTGAPADLSEHAEHYLYGARKQ